MIAQRYRFALKLSRRMSTRCKSPSMVGSDSIGRRMLVPGDCRAARRRWSNVTYRHVFSLLPAYTQLKTPI